MFLISSCLFAGEYSFKCDYKDIPPLACGVYVLGSDSQLKYQSPDGQEINIAEKSTFQTDNPEIVLSNYWVPSDMTDLYQNRFYDFDENGNIYFLVRKQYELKKDIEVSPSLPKYYYSTYVYKFSPVTRKIEYIEAAPFSMPHSICVSNKGDWIFVDLLENADFMVNKGKPAVYAIKGSFDSEAERIYGQSNDEKPEDRNTVNLCFDKNTQNLYFSIRGLVENKKVFGMGGLYSLSPDSNGNYKGKNLKQDSTFADTPFKLYSNKNGLWGLTGNSSLYSKLVHVKNPLGQNIQEQEPELEIVTVSGSFLYTPQILFKDDFILFLNKEKTDMFCYDNNKIKNITKMASDKEVLSFEVLTEAAEKISNEKKTQSSSGMQNRKLAGGYLILIFILILIIIFLSLWIGHLSNKSNQLKKDKKFVFGIQEAERGKISRDIHDSIIQDIRAIRIETELLKVDGESSGRKDKVINLATECVVKLRNICYNLTPAELATHEDGDNAKIELISIIQSLVLQFIERTHVPCQLKIDENFEYPVLDKDVSQNLFRIIQESLNNIEKHSYATSCQILIKNKVIDGKIYMLIYISDDGIGCDLKTLRKGRGRFHFGLQNIKDRAELIGATVDFQSEPGQGFEVKIRI